MQFNLSLSQYEWILPALVVVNTLLFVLVIVQNLRIGRLHKRLRKLFAKSNGDNLEVTINRMLDQVEELHKKQNDQQFTLNRLSQKLAATCGNVAVIRYNAFGDIGSDLSFSLALVDEQQNGVVITSIYGREESRTYAKPIEKGKSPYNLSDEELAVLKKASSSTS